LNAASVVISFRNMSDLMSSDDDHESDEHDTDGYSDSGGEEEKVVVDKCGQNAGAALRELLRVDSSPCSYSTAGLSELPALAGLQIAGLGDVSLPLAQMQALQSVAGAHKLAHGGDKRCNAWALGPNSVAFTNPAWGLGLERLMACVKHELGCEEVRSALCPL
jgi:hypothetical protein